MSLARCFQLLRELSFCFHLYGIRQLTTTHPTFNCQSVNLTLALPHEHQPLAQRTKQCITVSELCWQGCGLQSLCDEEASACSSMESRAGSPEVIYPSAQQVDLTLDHRNPGLVAEVACVALTRESLGFGFFSRFRALQHTHTSAVAVKFTTSACGRRNVARRGS